MESATIAISMVIELVSAKRNLTLKENITNVTKIDTIHQNRNCKLNLEKNTHFQYQTLIQMYWTENVLVRYLKKKQSKMARKLENCLSNFQKNNHLRNITILRNQI